MFGEGARPLRCARNLRSFAFREETDTCAEREENAGPPRGARHCRLHHVAGPHHLQPVPGAESLL